MRLDKKRFVMVVVGAIAAVFASIYLTFLVDAYTLNTNLQRVFVFCYFLLMCGVAVWLVRKFKKHELPKRVMLAVVLLAVVVAIVGNNSLLPKAREATISATALPRETEGYREVWLTAASLDGQETSLAQLELLASQGWIYNGDYDDYVFYPSGESDGSNKLSVSVFASEIQLTFAKNGWSGVAEIQVDGKMQTTLDLDGSETASEPLPYTLSVATAYSIGGRLLYGAGACVVIAFLLYVCVITLTKIHKNGGNGSRTSVKKRSPKMIALTMVTAVNAGLLFFTSEEICPSLFTKIVLLLLTFCAIACFNSEKCREIMKKYSTRGCYVWIVTIAVYASLASFGQRFFLNGNTRMHFSLSGLCYCISGILWFIPVIWLMLCCMERLALYKRKSTKGISRRKAWWSIFVPLAICQIVILAILWPGGFPNDAVDQLSQALGFWSLNDWHPVLHTLIERGILAIVPMAGAIVAVQMLLFTWLLTAILMLGYDRGVSRKLLAAVGCVLQILPNQALSWSNALKNFPYTLALLWGLYLLALLALRYDWCQKWTYYVCLTVDVFLILGLRHNGIVPAVAMVLLAIVLTIRAYRRFKLRLVAAVMIGLTMFGIYKSPVFDSLDVTPNAMSPYTTMLCAVGSCINKNLSLSEETMSIMEEVLPAEDWAQYYSRYHGHDIYWWYRPEGSVPYDTSSITAKKAFTIYFDALLHYPDVVMKDRLDGMDIMWDVVQPQDSFNFKSFSFISPFSVDLPFDTDSLVELADGSYVKDTALANTYYSTQGIPINSVLDILLWRTGAYLIGFLVLLLFWWKNHLSRLLWAAVPMLGNIAASLLVLYHQSFRYVYFIQVSVIALLFITICEAARQKEKLPQWNKQSK